jgi:hypothetical protein
MHKSRIKVHKVGIMKTLNLRDSVNTVYLCSLNTPEKFLDESREYSFGVSFLVSEKKSN